MSSLSEGERADLLDYLCGRDKKRYAKDLYLLPAGTLREAARYFVPMPKSEEARIWKAQKRRRVEDINAYLVPEDERVEDAALTDQDIQPDGRTRRKLTNMAQVYA